MRSIKFLLVLLIIGYTTSTALAQCQRKTVSGALCSNTFVYEGTVKVSCTTTNERPVPWCSKTLIYTPDSWEYCDPNSACDITTAASPCIVKTVVTAANPQGLPCVFPFTYMSTSYSDCTTVANGGVKWCATTDNYPVDSKWGACEPYTCTPDVGMTAAPEVTTQCIVKTKSSGGTDYNAPCVFPFSYLGFTYSECTTAENNGVKWCATSAQFPTVNKWGLCDDSCSVEATTPAAVFTTPQDCIIKTKPAGGNDQNKPCVFPFTYNGITYTECTTIGNGDVKWCATTNDYLNDRKWGNCESTCYVEGTTAAPVFTTPECIIKTKPAGGNDQNKPCVFPFTYSGITYTECTTIGNGDVKWCATTNDYSNDRKWGNCESTCYVEGTTAAPVFTTPECIIQTTSGEKCYFPFVYGSVTYSACTTVNNGDVAWCSTTADYAKDNKWGNCDENCFVEATTAAPATPTPITPLPCTRTTKSQANSGQGNAFDEKCALPFTYNGKTYTDCTTDGYGSTPWCSVHTNFAGSWGECKELAEGCVVTATLLPPVCKDTFSAYPNTLAHMGNYKSGANTVALCNAACLAVDIKTCAAFDFDSNTNACYVHKDGYLASARTDPKIVGVTQYRRQPCAGTTIPTVGSTVPPVCVDPFTEVLSVLSLGGDPLGDVAMTIEECKTACLNVKDKACRAFDLNLQSKICYWLGANYMDNLRGGVSGVNQYRRGDCTQSTVAPTSTPKGVCTDTLEKYEGVHAFEGTLYNGIASKDDCKKACLDSKTCMAVDWSTDNQECHWHKDGYMSKIRTGITGVVQYRRVPCSDQSPTGATTTPSGTCTDKFTVVADTLSYNGDKQSASTTTEKCKADCLKLKFCEAFDFDKNKKECYLHINSTYKNNIESSAKGVDQYRRERCVDQVTSAPGCMDTFESKANTNQPDGVQSKGVSDVDGCKKACTDDSTCQAFDYNTIDNTCWLLKAELVSQQGTVAGITHYYVKGNKCKATVQNIGCFDDVTKTFSQGGDEIPNIATEAACKQACTDMGTSCSAVDFSIIAQKCYKHSGTGYLAVATTVSQDNIVSQFRKKECPGAAATTTKRP